MSTYEYHQLLEFLYFEGYADSYEKAEELLEFMSIEQMNEDLSDLIVRSADWIRRGKDRHDNAIATRKEKKRQKKIPYAALTAEEYDIVEKHQFPLSPEELELVLQIGRNIEPLKKPSSSTSTSTTRSGKRKVRKQDFEVREAKTFSQFMIEAQLQGNDQQEFAQLRAQIRELQRRGRPGDDEKIKELTQKASEFEMGTQAKIKKLLDSDKPQEPENPNSITGGGYPQVGTSRHATKNPDDMRGQNDIVHPDDDAEARRNKITGSRYKKPKSGGGRGTNIGRSGETYGTEGR